MQPRHSTPAHPPARSDKVAPGQVTRHQVAPGQVTRIESPGRPASTTTRPGTGELFAALCPGGYRRATHRRTPIAVPLSDGRDAPDPERRARNVGEAASATSREAVSKRRVGMRAARFSRIIRRGARLPAAVGCSEPTGTKLLLAWRTWVPAPPTEGRCDFNLSNGLGEAVFTMFGVADEYPDPAWTG
jgi:hypothetical protein